MKGTSNGNTATYELSLTEFIWVLKNKTFAYYNGSLLFFIIYFSYRCSMMVMMVMVMVMADAAAWAEKRRLHFPHFQCLSARYLFHLKVALACLERIHQ